MKIKKDTVREIVEELPEATIIRGENNETQFVNFIGADQFEKWMQQKRIVK